MDSSVLPYAPTSTITRYSAMFANYCWSATAAGEDSRPVRTPDVGASDTVGYALPGLPTAKCLAKVSASRPRRTFADMGSSRSRCDAVGAYSNMPGDQADLQDVLRGGEFAPTFLRHQRFLREGIEAFGRGCSAEGICGSGVFVVTLQNNCKRGSSYFVA